MMKPMPLCPGPRPPYLENEVHCLKTRTGALEERASAADARMDAAEAATASAARLASEAMGAAAASAAGASVQRLVSPFLATLSLRSVDLPSAKRWLDSRDWAPSDAPACSVHVRSASSVRRWFDWRRDLASEFAVHVSGRYDSVHPFAVAGMSSMGMLCPAGSNPPPELVAFVPHMMVDGVNEAGVFAEVNVVPLKPDGSTGWSGTACPSAAAVYECLARFGSAAEAAAWIAASVYVPPKFAAATGYSVHFMLADASGAVWTVEDGAAREVSGSGDDAPCMSNFRLYGTDGSRSAGTAAAVAPYDPLGSGVERYALLKSGSYSVQDLFFTGAYASPSPRPSEFAGLARADGTPVTLANLSEQATLDAVASAIALYDPSDTSGKWWHTAHFAEYDLESRTFSVRVRETAASYSFGLFEKAAEGVQGGGGSQVQADWNEADSSDPAFILNKPVPVAPDTLAPAGSFAGAAEVVKYAESAFVNNLGGGVLHGLSVRGALRQSAEISVSIDGTTETYAAVFEKHVQNASGTSFFNMLSYHDVAGAYGTSSKSLTITSNTRVSGTRRVAGTTLTMYDASGEVRFQGSTSEVSVAIESDPPSDFTATFPDGTTLSFTVAPAVPYAKTTDIVQSDWSASTGPAAILNKPTPIDPAAAAVVAAGMFADAYGVKTALAAKAGLSDLAAKLDKAGGEVAGDLVVAGRLSVAADPASELVLTFRTWTREPMAYDSVDRVYKSSDGRVLMVFLRDATGAMVAIGVDGGTPMSAAVSGTGFPYSGSAGGDAFTVDLASSPVARVADLPYVSADPPTSTETLSGRKVYILGLVSDASSTPTLRLPPVPAVHGSVENFDLVLDATSCSADVEIDLQPDPDTDNVILASGGTIPAAAKQSVTVMSCVGLPAFGGVGAWMVVVANNFKVVTGVTA